LRDEFLPEYASTTFGRQRSPFGARAPNEGQLPMNHLDLVTSSVVRVGEGRGFVVKGNPDRLVITAAHCLPFFPPRTPFSYIEERTYERLLAPIGTEPTVWAECLFVDPIGDIAVLGPPDDQERRDQYEQYDNLLDPLEPISIADAPAQTSAWLLSLDKRWCQCDVSHNGGRLWFSGAADGIRGGMSGSPVLLSDGSAIGIVCTAGGLAALTEGGPNARLMDNLPGWLLRAFASHAATSLRRRPFLSLGRPLDGLLRLGRSLTDLLGILQGLHDKGVDLFLHQQGLDTSTTAGKAMFQMLGVFAEFERGIIRERVNAGLARAKAKGTKLGRRTVKASVEARIRELKAEGMGILKIGRTVGVGTSVVQRVVAAV
jgi:hypothetical protein